MASVYTGRDLRTALASDARHGAMWKFALDEFDRRGFSIDVRETGLLAMKWQASERGVTVASGASELGTAVIWARNGMREWARRGIQEKSTYFGEIARAWAKSQKASCTTCLGSTVDFLYLFSGHASGIDTAGMYPISSSLHRDLKSILLWVFVDWWDVGIVQGLDHTPVLTDQTDLHPDYHDSSSSTSFDDDQTHHFALYFYVGVKIGSGRIRLNPVLKRTHDIDDDGHIVNSGDYYLGITAAKLGDRFDDHPGFIGDEIARILQRASPEKSEDDERLKQCSAHLWVDPDGRTRHPASPAGNGGPGRFAAATSTSAEAALGGLPHPDSPASRTLDPLRIARDS